MNSNINITVEIQKYLQFCTQRKNLDHKTTKSYSIDLRQFTEFINNNNLLWVSKSSIEKYIDSLHNTFKPKSVKRKIATIKAFFHYMEIEEIIDINPFHKIQIKYKEPFILPKTIPIHNITKLINYAYRQYTKSTTEYGEKTSLRNIIILELLFATGLRISELCSLRLCNIDLSNYIIKIYGKGSKERLIQLCNKDVQKLLRKYCKQFNDENSYLFINRLGNRLSEQSVRNMITKYAEQCGITQHITPHMFRHSFATLLLEEDVDIRYIQQMLGHSSITTTQIYTHTSISKQKSILTSKHPRNKLNIDNQIND